MPLAVLSAARKMIQIKLPTARHPTRKFQLTTLPVKAQTVTRMATDTGGKTIQAALSQPVLIQPIPIPLIPTQLSRATSTTTQAVIAQITTPAQLILHQMKMMRQRLPQILTLPTLVTPIMV